MNLILNDTIYETTKSINYVSLGINLGIFCLILIASIILLYKIKLDTPGYKLLFVFYTFFWFPLMLVRSYRGTLNNDLEVDSSLLWVPLTVYGLVGIFVRPLFDFLGVHFKTRKLIVYISLGLQIATFIPLIIIPSFATNVIQSIGVGIGASCIGTFSLWFNEQHAKTKPFLTISILSLPPLLADFLASPIQSIIRSVSPYGSSSPDITPHANPEIIKYLWVIALVVIVINCFIGYFLRENRSYVGLSVDVSKKKVISTNNDWLILVGIILVGASIDFTKFATGDSIATLTIQDIGGSQNTAPFEGYVSAIFSGFQLIGGILMGLVLSKCVSKNLIYIFGAIFFVLYNMSTILITQNNFDSINGAIWFLVIQFLNGFGFGILYNLLIAHVLSLSFKTRKFSPLGLYQAFASLSIACGTFFTSFLKNVYKDLDYSYVVLVISSILIGITILMGIIYYFVNYIEVGYNHKELWKFNFKNWRLSSNIMQ